MSLQNSRLLFIVVHDIQGLLNGKECCYFIVFTKLDLKEKLSVIMGILSMDICSILKKTGMKERHTATVFVLKDRLVVSLKLTIIVN